MSESPNLEQEIADLSAAIEEKKAALERERGGAVESREVLHSVVAEKINQQAPMFVSKPSTQKTSTTSYLDDLSPSDAARVNALIDLVPTKGLNKAIEMAKDQPPYILDAFHDALTDKLHDELKRQKLI